MEESASTLREPCPMRRVGSKEVFGHLCIVEMVLARGFPM